ncbi:MAG TPA: hypothetical protein VE987_02170, partial [Polyangiaceae bacterium]|nr:hypothetical protein [Polyangiaceae bacterium]
MIDARPCSGPEVNPRRDDLDRGAPDGRAAASAAAADGGTGNGTLRFANLEERDAASLRFGRAGMIVVELEGIGPSLRGRLGEAIDEMIERELAARGACSPGLGSHADRDRALDDRLFRARLAGATGMAVVLGPLRAAAGALGALEPADCDTLRFLAAATRERPLTVLLDARDASTAGFGPPLPLAQVLACVAAPSGATSGA